MQFSTYYVNELTQVPRPCAYNNQGFVVYLHCKWVAYTRFDSILTSGLDRHWYSLRNIHSLRGTPGIRKMYGVVLERDTNLVKGYLAEAVYGPPLLYGTMQQEQSAGRPIGLERRLKWCRQVVSAVAAIHDRGFAVGIFAHHPVKRILIDEADNAVLCVFWGLSSRTGESPAEYYARCDVSESLADRQNSDVFGLGLWLWQVAGYTTLQGQKLLCMLNQCDSIDKDAACSQPHNCPVSLPPLNATARVFLDEVVSACRQTTPSDRIPAWRLLEMFPETDKPFRFGEEELCIPGVSKCLVPSQSTNSTQLQQLVSIPTGGYHCNVCGSMTTAHFYSCNICLNANFELCPG
jgi:hypothetical protein